MKKYDSYKDSGVEWIGYVPEHWDITKIKYAFNTQKGKTPKILIDSKNEGSNVYLSMDYLRGEPKQTFYVSADDSVIITDEDETLLLWDGSNAGEFIKSKKGVLSSTMALIQSQIINKKFQWFFFKSFESLLKDSCNGMGIPHVDGKFFRGSVFIVPHETEQTQIANYLDQKTNQIDTLISKKQQFIALLREERIAVINQAVTKGLDPKVKMKDSGIEWLGEIPEHWEVKKLKYLCKIINEKYSEKPDYVLALENIKSWTGEIVGNPYENKMEGDVNLFKANDILFNKLRPYLAKVIKTQSNGGCVGELLVLRANNFLTPAFLYFRLSSEAIITIVDNSTYGTKMPRASWEKFISLIGIGFPSIDEQNKIIDYIENKICEIEQLISKTQQEIELLKEYKSALISEVVTGKFDVRNEVDN